MSDERLAGGKLLLDTPAEAVVRIRISNPERRNALDHEVLDALAETLPRLDEGIETRCVVITGAPPVFSAGYDIASIPSDTFERDAEALVAHPFHAAMEAVAVLAAAPALGSARSVTGSPFWSRTTVSFVPS